MTVQRLTAKSAEDWLAGAGGAGAAVVYKHSPICAVSLFAVQEVRHFARDFPEIPVHQINVVIQRALARDFARVVGVPHESPQVVWLQDGRVVWTGSHGQIAYDELKRLAYSGTNGH